jgi:hypothetical protein
MASNPRRSHPIRVSALTIKSRWQARQRRKAAQTRLDEITARAAKLDITPDRVLEEYGRIAFANLGEIVQWDAEGIMKVRDPEKLGAVAEIVQSAGSGHPYRVKLYDKRAALDAIARYLGMVPLAGSAAAQEDEPALDDGEDPRRSLARKLARLAAEDNAGRIPREPDAS